MNTPSPIYACLYVKEFPAQALLRLRPELQAKPCVVMEGEPPSQHVCSLNARARQAGISPGMTRVEVDTFQGPLVMQRSLKSEAGAKTLLLECAGAFSPRVEDRSSDSAFLCGIDIAGTQALFGTPEMLGRSLAGRVRSCGIAARVVVSRNLHAAACVARGSSSAVRVIPSGDEAAALAPLSLAVLDLTTTHAETLGLWGIRTLGMLAALPETELIARMGQEGKRLRQLACGELPHLFLPVEPAFTLEDRMELDTPVDSLDALLFVVSVLLEQLILRATARILALAAVTITLSLEGGAAHSRTIRPALPSTDKQLWIKLIHLDLEAHPAQASILAVALFAEPGSTTKVQLGLFSPQLPEAARLDITLARIRAIVGEDHVGRAVLQDTHAPEAFHMEPFTVPSRDSVATPVSHPRAGLRQLRPAEAVSVTLQNARPAAFFFRDRRYVVERSYGPWLAGGEWWNRTRWSTEQWDLIARVDVARVADARAAPTDSASSVLCCCMVRDLMRNSWQMAALYD